MEAFEQQLQNLWKQGGRELAVAFLRRALSPDMNLQNLLSALQFSDVTPHLAEITVREVLGRAAGAAGADAPAVGATSAAGQGAGKPRRRRRSADELGEIRNEIVKLLKSEPGSLNTSQVVVALGQVGHVLDTVRVNGLMRSLQKEGLAADLGGKPKSWRATPILRRQQG